MRSPAEYDRESVKLALIGYGSVAKALIRLLKEKQGEHPFTIAGIHRRGGTAYGPEPVFGERAASVEEFLANASAQVLVELSTLNPETGEPASSHIRAAFARGMHVVTANKGPIAHAYYELAQEARRQGVGFLFESTVMDGAPVFNMVRRNLPGVRILGFTGVLNSTSNLVIEAMERGASFEEGIAEAKQSGITEENHEYDTEGWDSAAKTAALANVLMDARVTPAAVERGGIQGFTASRVRELAGQRRTVRLVSRAERAGSRLRLRVQPETLEKTDILAAVGGTSNLILFHTDLMGTVGTVSIAPGVEQTAYGVYADLRELVG
jgi:homoserine dehydrogenase